MKLEQTSRTQTTLPNLMKLLDDYGQISGYKDHKNSITTNYTPSRIIRQKSKMKWDNKSIKYLEILICQDLNNYMLINNDKIN